MMELMEFTQDEQNAIARAYEFADSAHKSIGQVRKYSGDPYIVHPRCVAETVYRHCGAARHVMAALLHDVVEDTPVTIEDIADAFGWDIASLVNGLTDVSKPENGNRAVRKAIDARHLIGGGFDVQFIKLADIYDNTKDICQFDKRFAKVYLKEIRVLLDGFAPSFGSDAAIPARHLFNRVNRFVEQLEGELL